jgi:hypothetical protein
MRMPTERVNPAWRWTIFAAFLSAAFMLAASGIRHAVAAHWANAGNPDLQLRAAEIEPSNSDLWYQLARHRQLDLENTDLQAAISYYQRATSINPISPFYWIDFASAYESAGNVSAAERAFRQSRELYPISADAAWRYGNFLLRQGRVPEGFQQIHEALSVDPKLTIPAVSVCWRATQNIGEILGSVLPDAPDENWGAIEFFVRAGEPLPAMAVWRRLAPHLGSVPLARSFPLIDMLIATGHGQDAGTVWNQALPAAGISRHPDTEGSLVWNGGFEADTLDGGFDWRFGSVQGAEISWDEASVHSGRRSLRVDFDGTANIDFQSISQYVVVLPATRYRFSAFLRTQDLTTESGVRFEIRDLSHSATPARSTAGLVGTQDWTKQTIDFVTGPDTNLLQLVLRRTPSSMLANKIRGTVWVDDVKLVPLSASGTRP